MSSHTPPATRTEWSGPRPFVGRDDLLATLQDELDAMLRDGGRAVFLSGPAGSGKTAILGVFEELAVRRGPVGLQTGYARCEGEDVDEPVWEQLATLFTHARRLKRAMLSLVPEWLAAIPVIGELLGAIFATVERLRTGRAPAGRVRSAEVVDESVMGHVRSLAEHGRDRPCMVLLDDLHRASGDDLAGAAGLVRRLPGSRILFVAAGRVGEGEAPHALRDLLREAERHGPTRQLEVSPLGPDDLMEAVSLLVHGFIGPEWLDWFAAESGGYPGPLWSALGSLEASERIRRRRRTWTLDGEPPEPAAAGARGAAFLGAVQAEPDRRLLALAALEGEVFHSAVLAELASISELEVEDRLAVLVRRGVIRFRGVVGDGDLATSEYAFDRPEAVAAFASLIEPGEAPALMERSRAARDLLGLAAASP